MKNAFINLLKIKSIITLVCLGVFVYASVTGLLPMDTVSMIIVMVFTYYFNKDKLKDIDIENKKDEEGKG